MSTTKKETMDFLKIMVSNKEKYLYVEMPKTSLFKNKKELISNASEDAYQPVHQDFIDELQLFVPHWVMRIGLPGFVFTSDYLKNKKALTDPKLTGFVVSGFSISKNGLISIIGGCKNETGQFTSMTAPITSINVDSSSYPYAKELTVLIENCFEHATDYFRDGKFGEGAQNTLDLKEPAATA